MYKRFIARGKSLPCLARSAWRGACIYRMDTRAKGPKEMGIWVCSHQVFPSGPQGWRGWQHFYPMGLTEQGMEEETSTDVY